MADPAPISFGARLTELADRHGRDSALTCASPDGEITLSWTELEHRARGVARHLAALDLPPQPMVVVALPNSVEHIVATFGAWKIGACVCPLRADLPTWEQDRLLGVAAPDCFVGDWSVSARQITHAELRAIPATTETVPDVVPNPAMAVASGGATGKPKLIVTPSPGMAVPGGAAQVSTSGYPSGAGHVQLVPGPLYHTNGFTIANISLFEDQRVVVLARFDAELAVDVIERHRVTVATMAPTMLARIADLEDIDERDLSSIEGVLIGAAACPPWLTRRWIDLLGAQHVFIAYGSTERVGLAMIRGDEWLEHPGSVGRGMQTEIRVLDDHGRDVAPGTVGEIHMRSLLHGDRPTHAYRGAPPAKRTADGFTSIGDMGWIDEQGYLYIADRRTDMVVSGGANVFPAEVETAISEHADVADVAVVGLTDPEWGQRVVAIVAPTDAADPPSQDELIEHARGRLAAYKVPKEIRFVDVIARTESGKLNRSELADQLRATDDPPG